jgi:nucleoside-diphosphate-sugar epimerase
MATTDTVVIFGGAGFIGRQVVARLAGKVHRLRVVSRRAAAHGNGAGGIEYLAGDVCDRECVREVVRGASVVFHLTIEEDFTRGARNIADACVEHGVRRLLFASTSDALYLGEGGKIDERAGPDPKPHLRNAYSRGKAESEALLLETHASSGLGVVILRPCLVVGPGGPLAHAGIGTWNSPTCCIGWGEGTHPMPFVLVQDVADAMVLAIHTPGIDGKAFNLAGDVFLSAREYVALLAERTKRDFRFYPRNLVAFWAAGAVKTVIKRWIQKGPVEGRAYHDIQSSTMRTQIDNSAAKQLLGWRPNSSLEVFVREAIDSHLEPLLPGDLRVVRPR